jgi:hypothetical protein
MHICQPIGGALSKLPLNVVFVTASEIWLFGRLGFFADDGADYIEVPHTVSGWYIPSSCVQELFQTLVVFFVQLKFSCMSISCPSRLKQTQTGTSSKRWPLRQHTAVLSSSNLMEARSGLTARIAVGINFFCLQLHMREKQTGSSVYCSLFRNLTQVEVGDRFQRSMNRWCKHNEERQTFQKWTG